jgi:hypothetical protein
MTLDLSMATGRSGMMASVASKVSVSPSLRWDADEVAAAQDAEIVDGESSVTLMPPHVGPSMSMLRAQNPSLVRFFKSMCL